LTNILCISPFFAPKADSEAFCSAKTVLELLNRGIGITVLSIDPSSPRLKTSFDDSGLWKPLKPVTLKIPAPGARNFLASARLGLRYRSSTYARWIAAAVEKGLSLHQENPFDLVYSRSLPMEGHIAGYWISRRLKIPWVANINDPWDWHVMPEEMRMDYPFHQRAVSNYWMRKTFQVASLVTYPSSRLRDYHFRISGVDHRAEIIPHIGYANKEDGNNKEFFRLVHAGKLKGLEKRSPHALLKGVHLLFKKFPDARKSVRLLFVGPEDKDTYAAAEELGIRSVVESTGRVSYERSLEYIQSATVCALVEGRFSEGIFLPSKLADYLAARKPVLALSPKIGVLSDLRAYRGVVRTDPDDSRAVASALTAYYHAFKSGFLGGYAPSEQLVRQFAPDAVTDRLCAHISEILDRKQSPTKEKQSLSSPSFTNSAKERGSSRNKAPSSW
jgi:glycosyltransferase involved in cell wall biosynthesis